MQPGRSWGLKRLRSRGVGGSAGIPARAPTP